MTRTVIVDIDGTLALREGDDPRGPFEYDRVLEDVPNIPVVAVVQALHQTGHHIVFLSGRENVDYATHHGYAHRGLAGTCYDATSMWISEHTGITDPELYMRVEHDRRKDAVVKKEIFNAHLADRDILCAIDDRDQVVAMWRSMGITCMQVAYGDF
ncbi:MAG TPA: hypothetical protein VHG10_07245 [Glycomyces sp.]|nr:hypothetical protein [Glycomyces sp.]